MTKLTAILPKNYTSAERGRRGMRNVLLTFGFEAQRSLQKYPAAMPWKSPTPKSGPRKDGRRTGTLGRNWKINPPTITSITVTNNTPYASYVQGPDDKGGKEGGQTDVMAERGWPTVTKAGEDAKKVTLVKADLYPK